MEPAQLRLGVVTWLQRKAFGRAVGSNARVLLSDVFHPGVVKVLILSQAQRESVTFASCKKLQVQIWPVRNFILYLWWFGFRPGYKTGCVPLQVWPWVAFFYQCIFGLYSTSNYHRRFAELDRVSGLSKKKKKKENFLLQTVCQCGEKDPDLSVEITFLEYQWVFLKSEALPCAKIKDLQGKIRGWDKEQYLKKK